MRNKPIELIMTRPPVVIDPAATLVEARALMARNELHHLPVVVNQRLVGLLSAADLLAPDAGDARSVAELMHRDPVSLPLAATLEDAATLLAHSRFHALPVTGPGNTVLGMVTTSDLLVVLLQQVSPRTEPGDARQGADSLAQPVELDAALHEAERRLQAGQDPAGLARAVVQLAGEARLLRDVLKAANLYLHSGQGEHEHALLVRAVQRAREGASPGLPRGRL